MAFVTSTAVQQNADHQTANTKDALSGYAALLLMGALAGATLSKATKKQYRALTRKMALQAAAMKWKNMFRKKADGGQIAGIDTWLFVVLAIALAAIGIWLFGLLGFLVVLALAVIIYLLLRDK